MRTYEEIREFLEGMDDSDILGIWNSIASYDGSGDELYDMYLLDDFFGNIKVSKFLDKLDSDFNHNDDYFYETFWGLASTCDIYDVVDLDELADRLESDWDTYKDEIWCDELAEFMNEEESEEE